MNNMKTCLLIVLFFAHIHDMVAQLKTAAPHEIENPTVKRTSLYTFSIDAYLGVASGGQHVANQRNYHSGWTHGLSSPIGLTYSIQNRKWRSTSLASGSALSAFVQLLDPLQSISIWHNEDESQFLSRWDPVSIFSPGIGYLFHFKNSRWSAGLIASYTPNLRILRRLDGRNDFSNETFSLKLFFGHNFELYSRRTPRGTKYKIGDVLPDEDSGLGFHVKGWRLRFENDFLQKIVGIPGSDNNYTTGIKLEMQTSRIKVFPKLFFQISLRQFSKKDSSKVSSWEQSLTGYEVDTIQKFGFGVTMFTPKRINIQEYQPFDRPYGNFAFLSVGRIYYRKNLSAFLTTDLSLGVIGSRIGEAFQTYTHDHISPESDSTYGWRYQVANGGHLAVNYNISYEIRLVGGDSRRAILKKQDYLYVYGLFDANVGNYMNFASLGYRLSFDTRKHLPPVGGATNGKYSRNGEVDLDSNKDRPCREGGFWSRFGVNLHLVNRFRSVFQNSMLTGVSGKNDGRAYLPQSSVNNFVIEFEPGITLSFGTLQFSYFLVFRSQEFSGGPKDHRWGGFSLGYNIGNRTYLVR